MLYGLRILDVAIVDRPANPDARFMTLPVSLSELRADLDPSFRPGDEVSSDRCLSACSGLVEVSREALAGAVAAPASGEEGETVTIRGARIL